ncbi:MAG: helix-turn-helix transcriptional regulator [Terriglobales bacterium]
MNFKELQGLAGWTQFDLSDATGIERTRLSFIENGHVVPSVTERSIIEKALLAEIAARAQQFNATLEKAGSAK